MRSTRNRRRSRFPLLSLLLTVGAVVGVLAWYRFTPRPEPVDVVRQIDEETAGGAAEPADAVEEIVEAPTRVASGDDAHQPASPVTRAPAAEAAAPVASTDESPAAVGRAEVDPSGYAPPDEITAVPSKLREAGRTVYPPAPLRGYGTLGGQMVRYSADNGAVASLLTIDCEDARRAGVVHAKFQSDLGLLGGVQDTVLKAGATESIVNHVREPGLSLAAAACRP
jgi:hypothetical protein